MFREDVALLTTFKTAPTTPSGSDGLTASHAPDRSARLFIRVAVTLLIGSNPAPNMRWPKTAATLNAGG